MTQKPKKLRSYSDFDIDRAASDFQLVLTKKVLFPKAAALSPAEWLRQVIDKGYELSFVSEKARAEFIVAPILVFIRDYFKGEVSVYSGARFDIVPEKCLKGVCDFIITRTPALPTIQAPVLVMVEAKKHDIETGIGQCAAEMVAAQIFNQQKGEPREIVYGCVTNGESWQFMSLREKTLTIDVRRYSLIELEQILGVLATILEK